MNKTSDKIKKGLNEYFNPDEVKRHIQCCIDTEECLFCTFFKEGCDKRTFAKLMKEAVQQLEAERDAAVNDVSLFPECCTCKHDPRKKGYIPNDCDDCINHCNWQWRGVQKEE